MNREINGSRYSTLVASDIERNGIALELHWSRQGQDSVVAEIFASDRDGAWTLSTFDCSIPLDITEEFIAEAKSRLRKQNEREPEIFSICDGDAYCWTEQQSSVMVKAVTKSGDPIELTKKESIEFANAILTCAQNIDPEK